MKLTFKSQLKKVTDDSDQISIPDSWELRFTNLFDQDKEGIEGSGRKPTRR